jgi:hypothetical protein
MLEQDLVAAYLKTLDYNKLPNMHVDDVQNFGAYDFCLAERYAIKRPK